MKRIALLFSVAALAVGCSSDDGGMTMNNPLAKKASGSAAPAAPDYFVVKKEGKTYVLGSNDSRTALTSGQMPALKETKLDNGKTVHVENSSYKDYNRLVAQYKKDAGL